MLLAKYGHMSLANDAHHDTPRDTNQDAESVTETVPIASVSLCSKLSTELVTGSLLVASNISLHSEANPHIAGNVSSSIPDSAMHDITHCVMYKFLIQFVTSVLLAPQRLGRQSISAVHIA